MRLWEFRDPYYDVKSLFTTLVYAVTGTAALFCNSFLEHEKASPSSFFLAWCPYCAYRYSQKHVLKLSCIVSSIILGSGTVGYLITLKITFSIRLLNILMSKSDLSLEKMSSIFRYLFLSSCSLSDLFKEKKLLRETTNSLQESPSEGYL